MNTKINHSNASENESESADIQTLARLAGLDRAMSHFSEDIIVAARTALKIRASFNLPADNTAEVWPVMQVKS